MFVFTSAIAMSVCFVYETTFANAGNIPAAYTFETHNYFAIAIPCKVFLFIPKIWSANLKSASVDQHVTAGAHPTSLQFEKVRCKGGLHKYHCNQKPLSPRCGGGHHKSISLRRESSIASTQRAPPQIATQKALLMQRGSLQMSTSPMDKMGMRPLHIATDRESIMRRVSLPIQIQRPSQDNEGLMKHPLHINNSYTTNQTDIM